MSALIGLQKNDWLRFQVADGRVLEGFVQEISPDENQVLISKAPDSPENEWHTLSAMTILRTQQMNAPV